MKTKPKKCKGTGKAKGHGCGVKNAVKYGLCYSCYSSWLLESDEGKKILEKSQIKRVAIKKKTHKAKIQKMKDDIETKPDLENKLQPIVNAIVRLIDKEQGCISCSHGWNDSWTRQMHGGHRLSVGSHHNLRFNLHNIHAQCSVCNNYESSNPRGYDDGLINVHGEEYYEMVYSLALRYKDIRWSKEDLKEVLPKARKIRRELEQGKLYSRDELNDILGLYK